MSDAWYVAEPEGDISGPYAFQDLLRAAAARLFAANAQVWHVDFGEWQPLARHVASISHAPPSSVPPREVMKPTVQPKAPKPTGPERAARPMRRRRYPTPC